MAAEVGDEVVVVMTSLLFSCCFINFSSSQVLDDLSRVVAMCFDLEEKELPIARLDGA